VSGKDGFGESKWRTFENSYRWGLLQKIESFYPSPSLEEEAVMVSLAQQGDENASAILLGIFLPLVYRVTLSFASRRKGSRNCNFYEDFEDFFGNCLDTLMGVVY